VTDGQIEELIAIPKLLPKRNWFCMREEFGYMRLDVSLESDSKYRFFLKGRCSLVNPVDFSAILTVKLPSGESLNLIRCNGHHFHRNTMEKELLGDVCHLHKATERYISKGGKPEGYAVEASSCYNTFEGALSFLMKMANIISPEDEKGQQEIQFSE
jgi:hypothetical protein